MKRMFFGPAAVCVAVVALIALAGREPPVEKITPATDALHDGHKALRRLDTAATAPNLTRSRQEVLLTQSDDIRSELEREGNGDAGRALRKRLRSVQISEEDARAWYEEHRSLFGDRSFAQSRVPIERLLAIARVRDELGLTKRGD